MTKAIFRDVIRKEWLFGLFYCVLSSFACFILSFRTFDLQRFIAEYGEIGVNGRDMKLIKDIHLFEGGNTGMDFFLFFLVLSMLVFFVLWGYLSYRRHGGDISLMRIRGISKARSQYSFYLARAVLFLFFSFLSLLSGIFYVFLFNVLSRTQHPVLFFNPFFFLFLLVSFLVFLLVSLPFYTNPYKRKRLIRFLRENNG